MISDAKIQEKLKWRPHSGQQEVLDCQNREVIVAAGRGWGKSQLMAYIVFRELARYLLDKKSFKSFIIAPTYQLTEKVFEHFLGTFLLKYNKGLGRFVSGGSNRPYEFKYSADTWIQCKSTTEPNSMLGERVDLEIVDEAARIPAKIYRQNIRPACPKGRVYYISTPRGRNWFQDKFYALREKNASFQFSSTDGVYYTEEMINEEKKETPELLFRQEYLAEFVSNAGSVFQNIDKIIRDNIQEDAVPNRNYIIGIDMAETHDWTVMVVIDTSTHNVVHIDRFKGRDYPLQKQHIIAKARRYNNARIVMDASGVGKPIYEDLRQSGLMVEDFVFTGRSKKELIGKLIVAVENQYIQIPRYQILIDELKAYEYKWVNEKTGLPLKEIQYGHPIGFTDDCVDALALAVWDLPSFKPRIKTPVEEEIERIGKAAKYGGKRRLRKFSMI